MKFLFVTFILAFPQIISAQHAAISAEELNVVYVGLKNPLRVAISGVSYEKTAVKSTVGTIIKKDSTFELIIPNSSGMNVLVSVGKIHRKDTTWVFTKKFRIRYIPKPQMRLGSLNLDNYLPISSVKIQSRLFVVLENITYESLIYMITSYNAHIISNKFGYHKIKVLGNKLEPIQSYMNQIATADLIFFDSIAFTGALGNGYLDSKWLHFQGSDIYYGRHILPTTNNKNSSKVQSEQGLIASGNFNLIFEEQPFDTIQIRNHSFQCSYGRYQNGTYYFNNADSTLTFKHHDTLAIGKATPIQNLESDTANINFDSFKWIPTKINLLLSNMLMNPIYAPIGIWEIKKGYQLIGHGSVKYFTLKYHNGSESKDPTPLLYRHFIFKQLQEQVSRFPNGALEKVPLIYCWYLMSGNDFTLIK